MSAKPPVDPALQAMSLQELLGRKPFAEVENLLKRQSPWADSLKLRVSESRPYLYCLSYDGLVKADFRLRVTCQCRRIVLEKDTNRIICYPFDKFFNAGEKHAAELDWSTVNVTEKVDGSLMKCYYDPVSKDWVVATNNIVDARDAPHKDCNKMRSFRVVWDQAVACTIAGNTDILRQPSSSWPTLPYEQMDKRYTYMFELCHPKVQTMVIHAAPRVVHLVTRWVHPSDPDLDGDQAGSQADFDFPELADIELPGIPRVQEFPMRTLAECRAAADKLRNPKQAEGFVVRDAQFRRLKIKAEAYVTASHSENGRATNADSSYIMKAVLHGEDGEVGATIPALQPRLQQASKLIDLYTADLAKAYAELMHETALLEHGSRPFINAWKQTAGKRYSKSMNPVLKNLWQREHFQPDTASFKALLAEHYDGMKGGDTVKSRKLKQLLDNLEEEHPDV